MMNGERKACTERILSAIEYGRLPTNETERRLRELIEAEVHKNDAEADMELIKACQSLMWQLHSHGEIPYDSHYDANKAKIDRRLRHKGLIVTTTKTVCKTLIAAAAVILVVLGLTGNLQWNWLEHRATSDQQQHIVTGNEIGVELIRSAIAEYAETEWIRVTSPEELADYISFVPMPHIIGQVWEFNLADMSICPVFISIDAQYESPTAQSNLLYSTLVFTDTEDAYFAFEQSAEGNSVEVKGHHVYVTKNMHRTTICWSDGLVLVRLSGEFQEQEGIELAQYLLEEWYR